MVVSLLPQVAVVVIADTHGYLSTGLLRGLELASEISESRVGHVIHAGDLEGRGPLKPKDICAKLDRLAPLTVVGGNTDRGLPDRAELLCGDRRLIIEHGDKFISRPKPHHQNAHIIQSLGAEPGDILISGHSHIPEFFFQDGIFFLNPGSAGPPRFKLPGNRCALLRLDHSNSNLKVWSLQADGEDAFTWTPWPLSETSDSYAFNQQPCGFSPTTQQTEKEEKKPTAAADYEYYDNIIKKKKKSADLSSANSKKNLKRRRTIDR